MIDLSQVWQYKKLNLEGSWHLAYYISKNKAEGTLAKKLIDFKDGNTAALKSWSNWAGDELKKTNIKFDYIVRSLGSKELVPIKGKPCAYLGNHLAECLNAEYIPYILNKSRETQPLHTLYTYEERFKELDGVYTVKNSDLDLNGKNVLIIDDITTTNCTVAEIKRALREVWPDVKIYLFCLGKTEYELTLNDDISMSYFI